MKAIGGIGAPSSFGGSASADSHDSSDDADEDDDCNDGKPETRGRAFKRYNGDTNAIAAPTTGGLNTFAYYYAEGVSTGDESWDPIAQGEAFQVDIMCRSEERIRENEEAVRMFYGERFGLAFEVMDGLYGVDIARHNGGAASWCPPSLTQTSATPSVPSPATTGRRTRTPVPTGIRKVGTNPQTKPPPGRSETSGGGCRSSIR